MSTQKFQKWGLIPIMIITPVILILGVFFMVSGVSIKEIPWWAIIGVSATILGSPFLFFLVQRVQRAKDDVPPLQKQKKILWNVFGFLALSFAIILIIIYHLNYQSFWVHLFCQIAFLLFMFFLNFRLFFPKERKDKNDNQNK